MSLSAFHMKPCNFPNSMNHPSRSRPWQKRRGVPLAIWLEVLWNAERGRGWYEGRRGAGPAAAARALLMNRTWCRPLIFCPARGRSLSLNGGPPPLWRAPLSHHCQGRCSCITTREGAGWETAMQTRHHQMPKTQDGYADRRAFVRQSVCTGVCMFTDGGYRPPDRLNESACS